uniref:Uncharacterized protein n=1 Tax=Trypanosoma brucei TaxID=5691 RepID=Q581H4_9TRYP|nr:hypothetical protein, unlikely [Trypanosoma brucei]
MCCAHSCTDPVPCQAFPTLFPLHASVQSCTPHLAPTILHSNDATFTVVDKTP